MATDNVALLVKSIKKYAAYAKRRGTVGMSKTNLKQVIDTRGLTLTTAYAFGQAFNEAVAQVKVKGFDIYDAVP